MENNQEQREFTPDDISYTFISFEKALSYLESLGLGDHAEEIYQEMGRKLHKARKKEESLTIRLAFTTLRNLARTEIRKSIRRRKQQQKLLSRAVSTEKELESCDPKEIALRKERLEIVRCTVKKMPKRLRLVMRLRGRGLTFNEIGRIMGLRPTTVRDAFYRGCKRIEARFIAEGLVEPERSKKPHKQRKSRG